MTGGKRVLCFGISACVCILFTLYIYMPFQSSHPTEIPFQSNMSSDKSDIKYILIWNLEKHWSWEKAYLWSPGRERFVSEGCEENRCEITNKRTERPISSFDAILFHQRALRWNDVPDPNLRKQTQRYIHFMDEAPVHLQLDKTSLKTMDNYFNWTFTYRQTSTFFTPYGAIRQVKPHPSGPTLYTYISSFGAKNSHLAKSKNSSSSIAWFVSNCNSKSNREALVSELQKYIQVDVYGGCGPLNCPKSEDSFQMLEENYRFYLSLENALCEDYITEKFFTIAQYNVNSVTLNGVEMSKFAPPNSYINVLDFETVKDLADYLLLLASNEEMYASYFWWKDFYAVTAENYAQGYCDLCKALHETEEETKLRVEAPTNMYKWWVDDAKCYKPTFH